MRYFPILFLSLMVFVHLYLLICLRRTFKPGAWLWIGYGIIALGFTLSYFRGWVRFFAPSPVFSHILYMWMGFLIILCLFLAARDALALFLHLFSRSWHAPSLRIAFLCGILGFVYASHEAKAIRIRTVTLPTARLPDNVETLRIVMLSDLHIQPFTPISVIDNVVRLANDQHPDILAVVGDFVDGQYADDSPQVEALSKMDGAFGKFAVLGNHERYSGYEASKAFIQASGFTLLQGDIAEAGGIAIAGVDDPIFPGRTGIPETLAKIPDADTFVLLLSHRPEAPEEAIGLFDLELSGHTHGGQIWPARYVMPYLNNGFTQGANRLDAPEERPRDRSVVYVSNGTRYWGPPVRFLTPPEITVITLIKEQ